METQMAQLIHHQQQEIKTRKFQAVTAINQ
jgi:hypothetical protein